jgi:hypothetical protein
VAPRRDFLSWELRGTNVDPDSFITTARSESSDSEIDGPPLGSPPTRLCNTPDILNIPLGPSIVPLLPEGTSVDFQRHMERFVYRLKLSELRAMTVGWIRNERAEPLLRTHLPGH